MHYEKLLRKYFLFDIVDNMNDIPCTYRISVKTIIKDDESRILMLQGKDGICELLGEKRSGGVWIVNYEQ